MSRFATAANVLGDTLLPGIFRRRRPPYLNPPLGNDLPEQGGYTGNMGTDNVLGPQSIQDQTPSQTVSIDPRTMGNPMFPTRKGKPQPTGLPQPSTYSEPPPPAGAPGLAPETGGTDSYTQALMAEPPAKAQANVLAPAAAPAVDKRGRPIPNPALSGEAQTLDYYNRVAQMPEDKKGNSWWPRIRAALAGFAMGGPVGAGAALGTRFLREHFDPTLGSREYKAQKLAELAPGVKAIEQQRKDAWQMMKDQTGIEYTQARTEALKHPKPVAGQIKQSGDTWVVIDPVTKTSSPVLDPKTGQPVKATPTGAKEEWIHDENGIAKKYRDGKDTGLRDPGRNLVMTDSGLVSPNVKYSADTAAGNKQAEQEGKRQQLLSESENERAQAERKRQIADIQDNNAATRKQILDARIKEFNDSNGRSGIDPEGNEAQSELSGIKALQTEAERLRGEADTHDLNSKNKASEGNSYPRTPPKPKGKGQQTRRYNVSSYFK